ncbi:uncharacterized protein LOC123318307 [Coccinella septempunctata]|uniref:uncharacterized protein LOC123318307 n=1 Tax=Coccinella septempunctata TaxID=41139 RepID=UPI001D072D50|nr:uncharacterized protein LOC123318307 [Coccinella septempunctata]
MDFEFESPVECLWIQPSIRKLSIVIGVVYRPPNRRKHKSKFSSFVNDVHLMLNYVCPMADCIFCIGDVNVNLLNSSNPLSECFSSYGFDQIIQEPTRVTLTSSTLLDPIFVKCPANFMGVSGVKNMCHISDHRLAFCECYVPGSKRVQKFITYRDFDDFDCEAFLSDLRSERWRSFTREPNINKKVQIFNDILLSVYDRHAPVRRRRISKPRAPWLTERLRGLMRKRDRAFAAFRRSGSAEDWNEYKRMRNGTLAEIRRSKTSYLLAASSDGNEAVWKALKSLNVAKVNARAIPDCLKDAESISDFCSAFNGVAGDDACTDKISYYNNNSYRTEPSFHFKIVSLEQIRTIMTGIRTKAVGDDDVTLDMLVHAFPVIESYVQHLVNSCIVAGVFPVQWKCAIGIPLPKTVEPTSFSDLRIISILPLLSKVLEKVLSDQISEYVNDFNLLPSYQSGFRKNHSTATTLASVTDKIFHDLDRGYSDVSI